MVEQNSICLLNKMELDVERIHSSTRAFGSGFMMLSTNLYSVFTQYLISGRFRAPPASALQELAPTFQDGAKTDRRALQSKFKSWAKRMVLEGGKLVMSLTGKVILPREYCEDVIKDLHFSDPVNHLNIDEIISGIQKTYTWNKKNFGMDWNIVVSILRNICSNENCIDSLNAKLFKSTLLNRSDFGKISTLNLMSGKRLSLGGDFFKPNNSLVPISFDDISHILPYQRMKFEKSSRPKTVSNVDELLTISSDYENKTEFLKNLELMEMISHQSFGEDSPCEEEINKQSTKLPLSPEKDGSGETEYSEEEFNEKKEKVCKKLFSSDTEVEAVRNENSSTFLPRNYSKSAGVWEGFTHKPQVFPDWRFSTVPNNPISVNAEIEQKLKLIYAKAVENHKREIEIKRALPPAMYLNNNRQKKSIILVNGHHGLTLPHARQQNSSSYPLIRPKFKKTNISKVALPLKKRILEAYRRDCSEDSKQLICVPDHPKVIATDCAKDSVVTDEPQNVETPPRSEPQPMIVNRKDNNAKSSEQVERKVSSNIFSESDSIYDRLEVIRKLIKKMEPHINLSSAGAASGKFADILDTHIDIALKLVKETKDYLD